MMKKPGIIGAMEIEVILLKEQMTDVKVTKRAGMEFFEGDLCGTQAVVVRSGVGKVNAAVCTQILADLFNVDCVINTGAAGSLDSRIDIGDFVLATDLVHHDVDATGFGYQPGEVPQLGCVSFAADESLCAAAQQAFASLGLKEKLHRGRIISGDQFIDTAREKHRIKEIFNGLCTEMEGASIAQACYLNDLPFIVIRAISDKADEATMVEYPVFERQAALSGAGLICALMERLPG